MRRRCWHTQTKRTIWNLVTLWKGTNYKWLTQVNWPDFQNYHYKKVLIPHLDKPFKRSPNHVIGLDITQIVISKKKNKNLLRKKVKWTVKLNKIKQNCVFQIKIIKLCFSKQVAKIILFLIQMTKSHHLHIKNCERFEGEKVNSPVSPCEADGEENLSL